MKTYKSTLILFAFISIFAYSCGDSSSNNWTNSDRNEFVRECNATGTMKDYCECILADLESAYPNVNDIDNKYGEVLEHMTNSSVGKCAHLINY